MTRDSPAAGALRPSPRGDATADHPPRATVLLLALGQALGLAVQAVAVWMARDGADSAAQVVSAAGFGLAYGSVVWALFRPEPPPSVRNAALVCLAVVPALQLRLIGPLNMATLDEQIHRRTLTDMVSSHGLFHENPYLSLGARYPGFEAVTVAVHQLGIPVGAAALIVVLISRLLLTFVLYDAVVYLTRSPWAGALAVCVYAWTPHFVFWLTQYAYVTLALPLALAAVALIARARHSEQAPHLLLAGAAICLAALAMTHHVTAMVTAAFLALWAVIERGKPGVRVLYGALIAIAVTVAWNLPNQEGLSKYLGSTTDAIWETAYSGLRKPYANEAAYLPPAWERGLLYYWTAAIAVVCLAVTYTGFRAAVRRRRAGGWRSLPGTEVLMVALVALIPPVIAARVLPRGGLVSDRILDFLFLPLALLAAAGAVRLVRTRPRLMRPPVRVAVTLLCTGVFVGAYLLSLPGWARLPGSYLPSADIRSMDSHTLAAVRWAGENLPPGSHVAADRTPAVLLASQAGLYPRFWKNDDEGVHSLYFAETWGAEEERIARSLNLRFLYVDRRMAEAKPLVGVYFFIGEQQGPSQLTPAQLAKFDDVPGIREPYRSGPISIYDLSALGAGRVRSGWYGEPRPVTALTQLLLGLSLGVLIATTARSRYGASLARRYRVFAAEAGGILTGATIVAAICVLWVALLAANVWLGPPALLACALVVLAADPRRVLSAVRGPFGRARAPAPRRIAAWSAVTALALAAVALATSSSWVNDVGRVAQILRDQPPARCTSDTSPSALSCADP